MSNFRIIPRLEIKGRNLIKGIRMEGLRKIGDPKEFGYLVAFLSSEYADYINGVNIPIDGGLLKSM